MKRKLIVILATLAATAGLGTAAIITGTSIFNASNQPPGLTTPFGKLVVTLNTSTQVATLDFLPNTAAGYGEIDGSAAGANFSQPVDQFALLGGALELSSGEFKDTSSGQVNGFGNFSFLLDNHNANTLIPEIKFSVHDAGTPWTTIQSIFSFTSGAEPADAVMHLNFGNGNTGFAAQTGPFVTSVPDGGATVGLLGLALATIGFLRRKFGV
jgi:hypothetical protein